MRAGEEEWGEGGAAPAGEEPMSGWKATVEAAGLVSLLQPESFWEDAPVQPGCILDIPVSQEVAGVAEPGCLIVFVQEVEYRSPGCWARVRFLGGEPGWARAEGIKVFSRERRCLHLCRGGVDACEVAGEKGYHVELFGVYPPGRPPPPFVEKAKVKEWSKLYQDLVGGGGPDGAEGAGPEEKAPSPEVEALDRISALRKRLQSLPSGGGGAVASAAAGPPMPPRVSFSPTPQMIEPRSTVKAEKKASLIIPVPSDSEGEEARPRRKKSSMADALAEAVAQRARGADTGSRQGAERNSSRSSSSEGQTSSSSSLIPPLQKKARKDPGSVLRLILSNVSEALAEAAVTTAPGEGQLQGRANQLSSYFQIVAKPQMGGKVRDLRELETLARCLDHLKSGRLAELGDALAGRFLAVESAAITNNWQDAQHLEVVPTRHAGLAPPSVLLQAQRHTRQVERSLGKNQWKRPVPYTPQPREGGGEKGGNGKGKGARGQGKGKFGKNANRGAWKETPKEKTAEGAGGGGAAK